MSAKIALYPIGPGSTPDTRLTNWAIVSRIADGEITPPPVDSWSRTGRMDEVIPYARRFNVPAVDVEALVRSTSVCWEYPMCDRDPLPHWSYGRVTLSATRRTRCTRSVRMARRKRCSTHAALPIGFGRPTTRCRLCTRTNATACLRPRRSCASTAKADPERVIDEVEKLAPAGFESVERVLSHSEREAIVKGYASTAGFTQIQVNK